MFSQDPAWYLIHCKSGKEQWVCQQLAGKVQETFCPLLKTQLIRWSRIVPSIQRLFPGYVFAAFDLDDAYFALSHTPGVRGLVSAGSEPLVVAQETIAEIKLRCPGGVVEIKPPTLQTGQRIQVLRGPMQGLSGVFDRYLSANQRVIVMLEVIGNRAQRTTLPASQVAEISVR
jgi:transcription antitermination factor NusG